MKKVLVTLLEVFGDPAVIWRPPQTFGARGIVPPLHPLVTSLHIYQSMLDHGSRCFFCKMYIRHIVDTIFVLQSQSARIRLMRLIKEAGEDICLTFNCKLHSRYGFLFSLTECV